MKRSQVDPITVEVLSNALLSVAEDMELTLVRTSYSTNIKERRDCSTAIFNERGETIAQAAAIPIHLGSMLGICKSILDKYPVSDIHEGDMFVANDPYNGGGTHLPDITIAQPVFYSGKIIGFVANIAHHSDVGGRVAGSSSGDCTSIYQEGLRIPPVKLLARGAENSEILNFILLNCRTPRERLGDLRAQIAANRIGEKRLVELFDKNGPDLFVAGIDEMFSYSERRIRNAIRKIPNGVYEFEDYLDDDGIDLEKTALPIHVKVQVNGDRIHLDFTGSNPQVKGGINVVKTALLATVYYAIKAILDPDIPSNAGYYRAIEVTAPEGSIVNAIAPASVGGRTDTCQRIVDAIFGAFAKAIPNQVIAGCNSAVTTVLFSGYDSRRKQFFVYPESLGGGFGARPTKDGLDGVHVHVTNSSNLPIESLEIEYPIMLERYELRNDSGGPGKFRGGLGLRRDFRVLEEIEFASHADRQKIPPWGLFGGGTGSVGRFVINPGTGTEKTLATGKVSEFRLYPGDVLSVQTPGSGGYGPSLNRDPDKVKQDVLEEKVSRHSGKQDYGINELFS
ncbi:hydantoinase B/oxoprolinase family protein [Alicyclobacillus tolerans]|uniref:hydantoinase B/oxoprolinase family protein n=1 Tax=Alicyclobacillus tolerans TaxID=90970 RepID=UPI001F2BDB5F|nr:hydantoinase B/oxoprolinase family protein [Alicyclobacillus tolerans]MCF8568543.1 hydantoinase B/oxoprolinase family protein [Alicyclobacillus tolerans]